MTTRRQFIRAASGLLLPSFAFAGEKYKPVPLGVKKCEPEIIVPKTNFDHSDFKLRVYTADYCEPCRRWKASQSKYVNVDIEYLNGDTADVPAVPYFHLMVKYPLGNERYVKILRGSHDGNGVTTTDKNIGWKGYVGYHRINAEIERQIDVLGRVPVQKPKQKDPPKATPKSVPTSGRWTAEELRDWAHKNYTRNTSESRYTVSPRSAVWSHLASSTHGFTMAQVQPLSQWEAMAVHSGRHAGQLSPYRNGQPVKQRVISVPSQPARRRIFSRRPK